ncbi:MAG: alpha-glucan family phosphorylase [Myxococcota bacterium]
MPDGMPRWNAANPVGAMDTRRAAELLAARLPDRMRVFAELAYDLACFWRPEGGRLFAEIDALTWEHCEQNPVRMLSAVPAAELTRAAQDRDLVGRAEALQRALCEERARPFAEHGGLSAEHPVAFVCAEFGVSPALPIYSGGLGVLAGDLLKEASDQGVPMVGLGLYYHDGYFHQQLDLSGWQHEYWIETPPHRCPLALVTDAWGIPVRVRVQIRGEDVFLRIWRAELGRTSLYLLDANLPENSLIARWLTARLYDAEREVRLAQYALLGIGGVRAARALGIAPAVIHLNEGHAAFAAFELAREGVAEGLDFESAFEAAREQLVFTTHTPVAAGNETYSSEEIWRVLDGLPQALGVDPEQLLGPGRFAPHDRGEPLGLTVLALRASRSANGVSRVHGGVARGMWHALWPGRAVEEVPIGHVTNGVHVPTWMAPPMRELLDRHLGAGWLARAADPQTWEGVAEIPDAELWGARNAMRSEALRFVRERGVVDALRRSEALSQVETVGGGYLSPDVLTLGFARRLASYKRLDLLSREAGRFIALGHPVQLVVAGKAHPRDDEAKRLLVDAGRRSGATGARIEEVMRHLAFVEDYDMAVARQLVAGCDVWLNMPRPPLEASGTSGMKAMLNGGLNLSVLDGWWAEAFDGANGWAITADPAENEEARDGRDARLYFDLLEGEVLPLFYERDAEGIPRGWIRRIKASLMTNGPRYCATRMLDDYVRSVYGKRW